MNKEGNDTTTATDSAVVYDAPEPWENYLAAAIIGSLSLIGLTCYIMVVAVLLRNRSVFKSSYYTMLLSLSIVDIFTLAVFLFYAVPCVLSQTLIFGPTIDKIIGALCALTWYAGVVFICTIAINRYWAVCRYASYKFVFSDSNGKRFVTIGWGFGLFTGIIQCLPTFGQMFYPDGYSFGFDATAPGFPYFVWFDRAFTIVAFIVLILSYVAILRKRPGKIAGVGGVEQNVTKEEQMKRAKLERNLALQFGVVVLVLIIVALGFSVLPDISFFANRWGYLMLTVFTLIDNGCNPFIYLAFNSGIRSRFLAMFCSGSTSMEDSLRVMNSRNLNQISVVTQTNRTATATAWT